MALHVKCMCMCFTNMTYGQISHVGVYMYLGRQYIQETMIRTRGKMLLLDSSSPFLKRSCSQAYRSRQKPDKFSNSPVASQVHEHNPRHGIGMTSPWIFVGLASSFPDITPRSSKIKLSAPSCSDPEKSQPACRIFEVSEAIAQEQTIDDAELSVGLKPQALVFRYRGKIHALPASCPHRSYPLSRGSLYDIEDFGIRLSAGIVCPKHGWSFDLFTGESDRGAYQMAPWEVETRKGEGDGDEEVWIRKKS